MLQLEPIYIKGLWGIPIPVVYQTPQGLHTVPYNGNLFLQDIRYMKQDGTLGNILPVIPLEINGFLTEEPKICVLPIWHLLA